MVWVHKYLSNEASLDLPLHMKLKKTKPSWESVSGNNIYDWLPSWWTCSVAFKTSWASSVNVFNEQNKFLVSTQHLQFSRLSLNRKEWTLLNRFLNTSANVVGCTCIPRYKSENKSTLFHGSF